MNIINFEEVKTRKQLKSKKQSKAKAAKQSSEKYLLETDNGVSESQRQNREYAQLCNQWYYDHVIGQDKDGRWIYKDL
ncbi:MAG: hypothetical protein HFH75_15435 [Lachnospiraceae bacterium]|jgi:hypothetical protein|nr:hypothetical protein [Lachnospiraceae bacterium]